MQYRVRDENGTVEVVSAPSARHAANISVGSVSPSDWGADTETVWVLVQVSPLGADGGQGEDGDEDGEMELVTVTVDPEEPDCVESEHQWESRHEVVGGMVENPGVFGSGGGIKTHRVCHRCGWHRWYDGFAQNPQTGEQGLESIRYQHVPSSIDMAEDE